MPVKILLADDDELFRHAAKQYLERQATYGVIGEAGDGSEAIRLTRVLRPDVVLMDIVMPQVGGLEATRRIKAEQPETKVIILTLHDESAYRKAAAQCGADAYVLKKDFRSDLLPTILAVRRPARWLCRS